MTYPRHMRLAVIFTVLVWLLGCSRDQRSVGVIAPPGTIGSPSFSYVSSGDGGTIVVPGGRYVASIWARGGGSGGGSFTISPSTHGTYPACVGTYTDAGEQLLDGGWSHLDGGHHDGGWTTLDGGYSYLDGGACSIPGGRINIGSGYAYSIGAGQGLRGASNELADGTRIVFSAGTSYVVTMNSYGVH